MDSAVQVEAAVEPAVKAPTAAQAAAAILTAKTALITKRQPPAVTAVQAAAVVMQAPTEQKHGAVLSTSAKTAKSIWLIP